MIWTLFRQDPALRTLRASIPVSLFTGIFLGAAVSARIGWIDPGTLQGQTKQVAILLLIVWSELMLFGIFAHVPARGSRLSLGLPIASRRLWLIRMGAILVSGWLPLAVITILTAMHGTIFPGGGGVDFRFVELGTRIAAGFLLALLLFQLPSPRLYRVRTRPGYLVYAALIALGVAAVLIVLPNRPGSTILLVLAAAIAATMIAVRLPVGFMTDPRDPEPRAAGFRSPPAAGIDPAGAGTTREASTAGTAADLGRRFPAWTVWRILMNHPLTWVAIPFLAFWGDRLVFAYREGFDLIPYYLLLLLYPGLLIFFAVVRMFRIDPLPISRITVFPQVFLPAVAAFAIGVGIGWIDVGMREPGPAMIHVHGGGIRVPDDVWELTTDGRAPLVTAPWGETYRPTAFPLYRGSRFAVYNPYEHGGSSSPRFVEFQLARAVEAIHGPEYLHPEGDAAAAGGRGPERDDGGRCCLPPEGTAGAGSPARHRAMATTALVLILLSSGAYALGLQQFRGKAPRHLFPWFLQGLAAPLFVAAFLVILGNATGVTTFEAIGTFPMVLIRKFGEAIPAPTAVIWILNGLAFALGYVLIQSRFAGIEAPLGQMERDLSREF